MAIKSKPRISPNGLILKDQLISINRVTKVVKGGKNMSFAALVVVGDESGHVGFGTGKAREVPLAIKKAVEAAKKSLIRVPLIKNTVPHQLIGRYGAGRVLVKPASEGTGVIAGGAVRAVMQAVGVHDGDEIVELVDARERSGLPHGALGDFAVAEQDVGAEIEMVEPRGQGHADADAQALPQ